MSETSQNNEGANAPDVPQSCPLKARENVDDVEMHEADVRGRSSRPFTSPSKRVVYSDRFIPSRAESSHLNYSVLERDLAAAEVSKSGNLREVGTKETSLSCNSADSFCVHHPNKFSATFPGWCLSCRSRPEPISMTSRQ